MRSFSLALLALAVLLTGCASASDSPELAREVVLKYIGEGFGTVGPFNRSDKAELASLSASDQTTATALLNQGALGFIVFKPGNDAPPPSTGGSLADLVKVERIVFVRDGKIAGDFAATK